MSGDPLQNVALARAERFGSDDDESTVTIAKPPVTVVDSVEKLNELRPKPKDPQAVLFEYEGEKGVTPRRERFTGDARVADASVRGARGGG